MSLNYSLWPGPDRGIAGQAHTDWGPLTILVQGGPGLEVISNGEWRAVPALPGTFVVNVGDIMERLSNGRFNADAGEANTEPARSQALRRTLKPIQSTPHCAGFPTRPGPARSQPLQWSLALSVAT